MYVCNHLMGLSFKNCMKKRVYYVSEHRKSFSTRSGISEDNGDKC